MSRRRIEIWPAFVDLFIALFVAALGGFVLTAGLTGQIAQEVEKGRMVQEAQRIGDEIQEGIGKRDSTVQVSRPGDEVAINLYVNFPIDESSIMPDDAATVRQIGTVIREALERLPEEDRGLMQVVIEGHTDTTPPTARDPREQYLYNWQLSSLRALSVLYEFREVGLRAEDFSVHAVGYADSRPRSGCDPPRPECEEVNRRTTIRLRPDYVEIESRLREGSDS